MPAKTLEIRLLGQFEVRLAGQVIDLPSRPAQSLLAYLALTSPTAHRRELLAGLLWPDAAESNARGYLRQALWRVRKAIGDGYLVTDELTVAFNPDSDFWLDTAELQRDPASTATVEELTQALEAYQGQLLPGFYSDWAALERERLQTTFEKRMAALIARLCTERRWQQVLDWGERWIALGQVPEPAYRALMLAHHSLGDRAGMAAAFQRCAAALQRELGVEPSAETGELYDRLLNDSAWGERQSLYTSPDRMVSFAPSPASELPHTLTTFIGREREVGEVINLLIPTPSPVALDPTRGREGEAGVRLLTLTGPGGSGKTRLAVHASRALQSQFPHGVWFVELAPLTDPSLVPRTVAAGLGVVEQGNRPVTASLADSLRSRQCLLILDNCEHLIEACASLAQSLLRSCPQLRVVATSREPLGIAGETVFQVPPLSIPDSVAVDALLQSEAVQLFIDRARAALPDFSLTAENAPAIAEICRRLDGIPLALELAAARARLLSPAQIAERLKDRFSLLTGGNRTLLPHQQTLRATMDWSYNLITDDEARLFTRLSVFSDGFTLEAAEAVCAGGSIESARVLDLLSQLVNKSLVVARPGGVARYHLLETIREYAREKLLDAEQGEADSIGDRHLSYYRALAERAEPELTRPNQVTWLSRLETELDNFRAALRWALARDTRQGLQLAARLTRFWDAHDRFTEGAHWLGKLLAKPDVAEYPLDRAWALVTQSMLLVANDLPAVQANAEISLDLFRAAADWRGEALSLLALGVAQAMRGDFVTARPLLDQSLAIYRERGDKLGQSDVYSWLTLDRRADKQQTCSFVEKSLMLSREIGNTLGIFGGLVGLAQQSYWMGDLERALPLLDEAVAIQDTLSTKSGRAWILEMRGNFAFRQGNDAEAETYYRQSIALNEEVGHQMGGLWASVNLAAIAARRGEAARARGSLGDAIQRFRDANIQNGVVFGIEGLAHLALEQGDLPRGAKLYAWADAYRLHIGDVRPDVEQAGVDRDLAAIENQLDYDTRCAAQAEGRAMTYEQAIAFAVG